jgi:hypothetical protein
LLIFENKERGLGLNNLKVKCYSGHTYADRPQSFLWEGIQYEVEEIEKEWLEPGERHFQVRTRENKTYQLCYDEARNRWSLTELIRSEGNAKGSSENYRK